MDDGPPAVTILAPADGTAVDGGTTVNIEAEVLDKFGGLSVELEIVEAKLIEPAEQPPYTWAVTLPAGAAEWTLRVNAVDADGGTHSQEVIVCTDMPDCSGLGTTTGVGLTGSTSDGGAEDGESSSTTDEPAGSTTGEEEESTSGPLNPTAPVNPDFDLGPAESGCHCRGGDPGGWSALILLAALGLSRSRRRARRRA